MGSRWRVFQQGIFLDQGLYHLRGPKQTEPRRWARGSRWAAGAGYFGAVALANTACAHSLTP